MAAIAAADVTYTDVSNYSDVVGDLPTRRKALVKVTFGGSGKTYTTNGIPLTTAGLSMTNFVESAWVVDSSLATVTHIVSYDVAHNSLRLYSDATTEFTGSSTAISTAQTYILRVVGF